jgi:hypothetical protein
MREIQRKFFDAPDLSPGSQIGSRRKFAPVS